MVVLTSGYYNRYSMTKGSKIEEANILFALLVLLLWDVYTKTSVYSKDILVWERSTCSSFFTCLAYINFLDWALMCSA